MENSKIEWCDHTFNPWRGCTKVSPGCEHCYAEALDIRWAKGAHWGKGKARVRTSEGNWNLPLRWQRSARRHQDLSEHGIIGPAKPRPRVFCASLADWLDDEVPIEWLADLLALIHATPNLDWLLLTKRPENWLSRLSEALTFAIFKRGRVPENLALIDWLTKWHPNYMASGGTTGFPEPPKNVWIGTTVEDQARAHERIPELLKIPAPVRFLSCEPLLEEINFTYVRQNVGPDFFEDATSYPKIDWVICGGESGPGARQMSVEWAEFIRDQCHFAGVPFFMKQMGGHPDKRARLGQLPFGLDIRQFPTSSVITL